MKLLSILFLSTIALAGCSSTTKPTSESKGKQVIKVAKSKGIKCKKENPTGSRLGSYKCTSKQQREAKNRTANRVMQNQAQSTTGRAVDNGGE